MGDKTGWKIIAHGLRRSYATHLYYATGKDIKVIQQVLGQASLNSSSIVFRLGTSCLYNN